MPTLGILQIVWELVSKFGIQNDLSGLNGALLAKKFAEVRSKVVARLIADAHTPALLGDTPDHRRQLIRTVEYHLWKEAIQTFSGKNTGISVIADAIRDRHDDYVVSAVEAKGIDTATTTDHLVGLVIEAEVAIST